MKLRERGKDMVLTPEQEAQQEAYFRAVDILRAAGIEAKYVRCFITKPADKPGYITIGERK